MLNKERSRPIMHHRKLSFECLVPPVPIPLLPVPRQHRYHHQDRQINQQHQQQCYISSNATILDNM
eukprot:6901170-Prorocentrum_lima.AAC.1